MFRKILKLKVIIGLFLVICIGSALCFTNFFKFNETKLSQGTKIKSAHQQIEIQWDEQLSPKIEEWFKRLYSNTRFNGNVLVAKGGKVIYRNSYGYSNYQTRDTMTINHRFQTGSISKTFTAMAVLILKERGLLNYDDPVEKFIKGFPYTGVTIRMLLTHRSGLPNYNYFADAYTDRETVIYNNDVIRMLVDSFPAPYYQPDERFDYCNTNFVVLAYLIEKVSGQPFETFMRNEVFNKAGMLHTRIYINRKQARIANAAIGYHFPWTVALTTYQDGVSGDKGVYSTVDDLWYYSLALDKNILVKSETLAEALIPGSPEKKGNKNYGLGWRLSTAIDSSKFVFHTGWWRGFNGMFIKDIKNDAVYIVLSNVRNRAMYAMLPELMGIIDPQRRQMQIDADSLYQNLNGAKDTVNVDLEL